MHFRRDLQRETGLADAAHPGQRHQRRPTDQLRQRRDLGLAPDERRHLTRQVVARERVQRAERRELPPQIGMGYLKQALRPPQVTQPVLSQVDEPVLLGERVVEQLFRRG